MPDSDSRLYPFARTALLVLITALVAISPFLHFKSLHNPDLPRYLMLGLVAGMGLAVWGVMLSKSATSLRWHPALAVIITFVIWASASALWTQDPNHHAIDTTQLLGLMVLGFLAQQIASARNTRILVIASVGAGSIVALLGIWQNFYFNPFELRDSFVMGSTMLFKNHASLYLDLITPVAFMLMLTPMRRTYTWLAALAFAVCLGFQLDAHTRGSWLALGIAFVALIILTGTQRELRGQLVQQLKHNAHPVSAALMLAFAIFALPGSIDNLSRQYVGDNMLDTSSEIRLQAYKNALPIIRDHWLTGVGFGAFRESYRSYMPVNPSLPLQNEHLYMDRLHNDPLQYVVELGIPGGLLVLAIFAWTIIAAVTTIRRTTDPLTRLLVVGLLLALVTSGVHSFVDFPYHKPSSSIQFWLWLGTLLGLHATVREPPAIGAARPWGWFIATFAVLLTVHTGWFYTRYIQDNRLVRAANLALRAQNCTEAKSLIDAAAEKFGLYFITHTSRVDIYIACERDLARLLEVIEQELRISGTNIPALLARANLQLHFGSLEKSRADFTFVTQLIPQRASGYIGLAKIALKENHLADARRFAETAQTHQPQSPEVKQLLQQLQP